MSLFIASINSGSNGNCYYIGNGSEAVLIDAGISCRETEKRMLRMGLNIKKVKAIVVSHEHTDHIRGLERMAIRHQLPVYITQRTRLNCNLCLPDELICLFESSATIKIGSLTVSAFSKLHDAAEPHSFIISNNGVNVGVFTDLGLPCHNLTSHFGQCHAAFLEANYDNDMLQNGRYPYYLKRRISGGLGHLSNKQALEVFTRHRPPFMSHLLLAHLSKENNCPELVMELFSRYAGQTHIAIASRDEESAVYHITDTLHQRPAPSQYEAAGQLQYSLF